MSGRTICTLLPSARRVTTKHFGLHGGEIPSDFRPTRLGFIDQRPQFVSRTTVGMVVILVIGGETARYERLRGQVQPPFVIRRLSASDIRLFRGLLATFGKAFEEIDIYTSAQPRDAYLDKLLGGEGFIALAAVQGDAVIGGLAAYELVKFEQERSEIYIYDLAVDEDHRRKGVATALIAQLRAVAAERGAYVIFVQADYGDDAAIALYTKLGAREDVLHFDIATHP